jgi:hypothetical protein
MYSFQALASQGCGFSVIVRNDGTKAGLRWERDGRNERQGLGDGSSPAGRRQGTAAAHSWRSSDVEVLGVTAWLGAWTCC